MNIKERIEKLYPDLSIERVKSIKSSITQANITESGLDEAIKSLASRLPSSPMSYTRIQDCPNCNKSMASCTLHNERAAYACINCRIVLPKGIK